MLELKITVVVTALFAIMIVPLVSQITMRRIQLGNVAIGDANDFDLRKKIETLSNFCEYVPLGLIILALLELNYAHENYALVFGVLFLAARILHALGMLYVKAPLPRAIAMLIQHISFLAAAGMLLKSVL